MRRRVWRRGKKSMGSVVVEVMMCEWVVEDEVGVVVLDMHSLDFEVTGA